MQVPAYWPVEVGIQCGEYKGVFVEVKNVIAMDGEEGEEEEELMSDMEEGEADAGEAMAGDIDMLDVEDMFNSLVGYRARFDDPSVLDYGEYRLLLYADNESIMSDGCTCRLRREKPEDWQGLQRFMRLLRKSWRKP